MNKQSKKQQQSTKVWIKLSVLVVIIVSTVALLGIYVAISNLQPLVDSRKQQATGLSQDIQNLQDAIDHKDTDEGVKDVAQDELGMVDPDTIIYEFD
jgi:cell division protein FtsB